MIDAPATEGPLAEAVTDDAFLGGALNLLQPASGYRAGLDAVLLAAAVEARPGEQILDVGSGVGAAGLARGAPPSASERHADRARSAARRAGAQQHRAQRSHPTRTRDRGRRYPPAWRNSRACRRGRDLRPRARQSAVPDRRARHVGRRPVEGGGQCHAGGCARSLAAFRGGDGTPRRHGHADPPRRRAGRHLEHPRRAFRRGRRPPLHPREGEPASRFLVQAVKGSRAPLELRPGLVLHNADHSFRSDIEAILRRGGDLPLRGGATG